jgi:hypothetical protein
VKSKIFNGGEHTVHERKKKLVRRLVREFKHMLHLQGYKTVTRFKTGREDKDIQTAYAIVELDSVKKSIYIKFSSYDFNRMKMREIKRYVLHELLHSYFNELNELFEEALSRGHFSEAKRRSYLRKFDQIEHLKINRLIRVMFMYERLHRQVAGATQRKRKAKARRRR